MGPSPTGRPSTTPSERQSALSANREPFVPPRQVLDPVSGRVLDPSTAMATSTVRPRSTVYVGPRLLVARTPETATVIERLQRVAARLGWAAQLHPGDVVTSDTDVPGVVRLDLTILDQHATIAPDGWVLLQHARVEYGVAAMSRVGLDHIVLVRSLTPNPFTGPTRSTAPTRSSATPGPRPSRRTACRAAAVASR